LFTNRLKAERRGGKSTCMGRTSSPDQYPFPIFSAFFPIIIWSIQNNGLALPDRSVNQKQKKKNRMF
jgi:hypothetical protein